MSDCYYHRCEKCSKLIPMHIGLSRERNDYKVYCKNHIKYALDDAGVFMVTKGRQVIEVKLMNLPTTNERSSDDIHPRDKFMPQTITIAPGWACAVEGPDVGLRVELVPGLIKVYSDTPGIAHPNVGEAVVICSKREWIRKRKHYIRGG